MIDKLIQLLRDGFSKVPDNRRNNNSYELRDILSIGFAMFSLKDPSLTFFREEYPVREENLQRIYGIDSLPGDTAFREILDEVDPQELQRLFELPMNVLREEKVFEQRQVLGKYTAVSVDQ